MDPSRAAGRTKNGSDWLILGRDCFTAWNAGAASLVDPSITGGVSSSAMRKANAFFCEAGAVKAEVPAMVAKTMAAESFMMMQVGEW